MAQVNNPQLTLTTVGNAVTVKVTYKAVFTQFERHLASNGLRFRERITVVGVDPGVADTTLHTFASQNLPVTAGTAPQTINRSREINVSRASLQEDPALGDADEIRCRIKIEPIGMPVDIEQTTSIQTLLG